MKKYGIIFILVMVVALSGCSKEDIKVKENEQATEGEVVKDKTSKKEDTVQATDDASSDSEEVSDNKNDDNDSYDISKLDDYMASVEKKAKDINDYLENEAMTQDDMNTKSKELYDLWDEALNYVWTETEKKFNADEFSKLKDEQRKWLSDKEDKVKEAGKEFEGGSMYALTVNSEGAKLTEERVKELYKKIK